MTYGHAYWQSSKVDDLSPLFFIERFSIAYITTHIVISLPEPIIHPSLLHTLPFLFFITLTLPLPPPPPLISLLVDIVAVAATPTCPLSGSPLLSTTPPTTPILPKNTTTATTTDGNFGDANAIPTISPTVGSAGGAIGLSHSGILTSAAEPVWRELDSWVAASGHLCTHSLSLVLMSEEGGEGGKEGKGLGGGRGNARMRTMLSSSSISPQQQQQQQQHRHSQHTMTSDGSGGDVIDDDENASEPLFSCVASEPSSVFTRLRSLLPTSTTNDTTSTNTSNTTSTSTPPRPAINPPSVLVGNFILPASTIEVLERCLLRGRDDVFSSGRC